MDKFKNLFQKIKSIKHIHIYVAVLIAIALCLGYFGFLKKDDKNLEISTETQDSTEEYVKKLENKLANVLSKISGAGNVSVLITLECGFGYEYASNEETRTTSSGDTLTTKSVIMVSNEPVVEREIYPKVKGVVIVASGAGNFSVKMNLMNACMTVLEIDSSDITILN